VSARARAGGKTRKRSGGDAHLASLDSICSLQFERVVGMERRVVLIGLVERLRIFESIRRGFGRLEAWHPGSGLDMSSPWTAGWPCPRRVLACR
jgi:hypothetical protein